MEQLEKENVNVQRVDWSEDLEKIISIQGVEYLELKPLVEVGVIQLFTIRSSNNELLGLFMVRFDNNIFKKHLVVVLIQGVKREKKAFPIIKIAHPFLVALAKHSNCQVLRVHSMRDATSKMLENIGFSSNEKVYCQEV